jgi:hypothetical protein
VHVQWFVCKYCPCVHQCIESDVIYSQASHFINIAAQIIRYDASTLPSLSHSRTHSRTHRNFTTHTGDAWVAALEQSVEAKVTEEHADYDWAVSKENPYSNTALSSINLDMRMLLADGDAVIADSSSDGGFLPACRKFEAHVQQLKAAAA